MDFRKFVDTMGGDAVRSLGRVPDSTESREMLKLKAEEALGKKLSGYRFTGSILRSENPQGFVGIVAW